MSAIARKVRQPTRLIANSESKRKMQSEKRKTSESRLRRDTTSDYLNNVRDMLAEQASIVLRFTFYALR